MSVAVVIFRTHNDGFVRLYHLLKLWTEQPSWLADRINRLLLSRFRKLKEQVRTGQGQGHMHMSFAEKGSLTFKGRQ